MNENLKEAKLKFAINRTNLLLTLTQKDVVVKENGNPGHKCQAAREKYSYDLSRVIVATDQNLLQQNAKKITAKRIKAAVKQTIEDANIKDTTLSA